MSPFLGIALSVLPDLAKRLTRRGKPETRSAVVKAVQDVLGTDDAGEAQSRAAEPDLSNALRLRLAEIENDEAAAELAERELSRQAELEKLRLEIAGAANAREDAASARDLLAGLSRNRSVIAWGPVAVSAVVVVGFFATLLYLINGGLSPDRLLPNDPSSQLVFQIVNIAVGTLTAGFATVISFWLGSSDGSRRKDVTLAQAQIAQQDVHRETVRQTQQRPAVTKPREVSLIELEQTPVSTKDADTVQLANPPKADNFAACITLILAHEGGYIDHPDDPGGATNLGITHLTLADWRGTPVTKSDVRALQSDEAKEIYRARYWNALNCDGLPAGVDLVVFDFGVNAGPARAARMLQAIVGATVDGQIGPKTLSATAGFAPDEIVTRFSDDRLAYYRKLKHWSSFGRGWTRRTEETRDSALAMTRVRLAA